jgi:hypothetical protein
MVSMNSSSFFLSIDWAIKADVGLFDGKRKE